MLTKKALERWTEKNEPLIAIGVRLPKSFLSEGRLICQRTNISFSQFVRKALAREFLSRKEK